jgi:hypothetical protein
MRQSLKFVHGNWTSYACYFILQSLNSVRIILVDFSIQVSPKTKQVSPYNRSAFLYSKYRTYTVETFTAWMQKKIYKMFSNPNSLFTTWMQKKKLTHCGGANAKLCLCLSTAPPYLNSALGSDEWLAWRPNLFIPGKHPPVLPGRLGQYLCKSLET